ncbi:MAG: hypothetical protein IJH84_10370 [Saccharopolyspora sp.]|nr:hypothetical protein [Saccharopolyspora sp.]
MAPRFRSRPDGSKYPIGGGGGAATVIAGGAAFAIWAASSGAGGIGAGVGGGGGTAASAMSAAESAVVRNISKNLSKARKDVQRGKPVQAWRRLGLRKGTSKTREAAECAVFSYGRVQDFFTRNPCRGLHRVQFPVSYDGGSASVLVSRVQMRNATQARQFRRLIDEHGSGDVEPFLPDVQFTGEHYDSARDRSAVFVAEAESASGDVPDQVLDSVAEAAVLLARRAT